MDVMHMHNICGSYSATLKIQQYVLWQKITNQGTSLMCKKNVILSSIGRDTNTHPLLDHL